MNANETRLVTLPRGDRDAMEEFINNIRILIGTMNHKVLEPLINDESDEYIVDSCPKNEKSNRFYLSLKGIKAQASLTEEGLVVEKGSEASLTNKDSLGGGYKKLKDALLENNTMSIIGDKLVFQKDYLFSSPSQAAAIIVGYAINGRKFWINKAKISLKEYEEQQFDKV